MKQLIIILSLFAILNSSDNIDSLLNDFSDDSQLFKKTKVESAGELIIFSRRDLDVMQAKLLEDVIKSIRNFTMQEDFRGNTELQRSGASCLNSSCIRIYIDDQETSSASSGSALHIFGAYDISHIDHIEVYIGGSDLKFGHEYGFLTIKMYTKDPHRENGSQVSFSYGSNNSKDIRAMTSGKIKDKMHYLLYASQINENNNPLKNKGYTINMNSKKTNIFTTFKKDDDYTFVLSHYSNDHNTPGGYGPQKTAQKSKFDSLYQYASFTKYLNTIKLQMSYAHEEKSLYNKDVNGVVLYDYNNNGNTSNVETFNNIFNNSILKASVKNSNKYYEHLFTYGVDYQRKKIKVQSIMDNIDLSSYFKGPDTIDILSTFGEYHYNFNENSLLVMTLKNEKYKGNSDNISDTLHQKRIGYTQNFFDNFKIKFFSTSNEVFPSLQELASIPRHIDGNVKLKPMQVKTHSTELSYSKGNNNIKVGYRKMYVDDVLKINTQTKQFISKDVDAKFNDYFIDYAYIFNSNHKIMLDYYWTKHNRSITASPEQGGYIKLFNSFGKYSIYNELIYRKGYYQSSYKMQIADGYDYNLAITYKINKKLTLSIKGENLLNKAIKAPVKNLYPVGVTDKRGFITLEYFF